MVKTNFSQYKISPTLFFLTVVVMFQIGCSNQKLVPIMQYLSNAMDVNYCTVDAADIKSNLKFIVVFDRSGSNQKQDPVELTPPSDINGDKRFPPIIDFVTKSQNDPFIYWSLIDLGTSGNLRQPFTNNQAAYLTLLNQQYAATQTIDVQWTNYLDTLDTINKLISDDVKAAKLLPTPISSTYVVFFVSDGFPIVAGGPQSTIQILNSVKGIMTLKDQNPDFIDSIQMNTALYYSNPLPLSTNQLSAQSLLQSMASSGLGSFLSFGAGAAIDFTKFAVPERIMKYTNAEFWIENENTVWENGILKLDSDGDGLSDDLEVQLGSKSSLSDSDNNGVSDLVEYRLKGKACKDASCSLALADPYAACSGIKKTAGLYVDSDNDGLNDCEELLLGSNPKSPDSNDDLVPDFFAFRRGLAVLKGSNDLLTDPDFDGVSNYYELLKFNPINFDNNRIPSRPEYSYFKTISSDTPRNTCYNMSVSGITTFGFTNKIRIFLADTTSLVSQKRVYRTAEKQMVRGTVSFAPGDFK